VSQPKAGLPRLFEYLKSREQRQNVRLEALSLPGNWRLTAAALRDLSFVRKVASVQQHSSRPQSDEL